MVETVLVTGASAGFGWAICQELVKAGYRVIGAARRLEKLQDLKEELGDSFYPLALDLTSTENVNQGLASLPNEWQEIDSLINNAGLALGLDKAQEANFGDWETMMMTNMVGLAYLTHALLPKIVERQGYVINMGSIAGTYPYPGGNIYGATKAFVKQFSLNLRADLVGTGVRVTNLEPGLAGGTEFSLVRFKGDQDKAEQLYQGANSIQPKDIARTILWLLEQPAHLNINRLEIMPTSQSFGPLPVHREP
ncbi:SDR family oxidoreductase [Streptococcus cuniculipharyngis]|uniref:SDR family oxidoreductase n=1 Tax=Streptococcus cuniculipharyngis TaxID=1562651 RepID=A0A5C5SFX9_9STRE|nr:SDR family oxidoreductase [Streptococcus cuniculipharyngis]TWS98915.1 SDR family oxidoreductase [Streptococcus cuniculipharyngis]